MAIYGIGAYYSDEEDVSGEFISNSCIGTGWDNTDAPDLHAYFRSLKVGDVVYIKAANFGTDITVKAIGIVSDDKMLSSADFHLISIGRNVKWINKSKFVIPKPVEKNNVRSNTVYEEFNPIIQRQIIDRIG